MNHFVLSIGANVGSRAQQLLQGLRQLEGAGVEILRWSRLYETAPVGVVDQPAFLNAAVWGRGSLGPRELLDGIKRVEQEGAGRDPKGRRWGPRPLDIDIIAFNGERIVIGAPEAAAFGSRADDAASIAHPLPLEIPHPRWFERDFVLAPLSELCDTTAQQDLSDISKGMMRTSAAPLHGVLFRDRHEKLAAGGIVRFLSKAKSLWAVAQEHERRLRDARAESGLTAGPSSVWPVVPLSTRLPISQSQDRTWAWGDRPQVMGILNATPDSFSDGGRLLSPQNFVQEARRMVRDGATVIDVGGQSTRPGASRLPAEEELARVLPVLEALGRDEELAESGVLLSVDTFYSQVAEATVKRAGVHIINDVSGGLLDPRMHSTVAGLGVPYVAMHMRGDPTDMQAKGPTTYTDIALESGAELAEQCARAVGAGLPPWSIILDPGIGFAKTAAGNEELVCGLDSFRSCFRGFGGLTAAPTLIGLSRKGFLGQITGEREAAKRDTATAAACAESFLRGGDIFRVHSVRPTMDALLVTQRLGMRTAGPRPAVRQCRQIQPIECEAEPNGHRIFDQVPSSIQ